jgi:hypothetical protein
VPDEAALELRVSRHNAADRLARAKQLTRRLPGVLELLREGVFEGYVAGRIADATAFVNDDKIAELDVRLYAKVRDGKIDVTDPEKIVRAAHRLGGETRRPGSARPGPPGAGTPQARVDHGENGMSTLLASLPADVAASAQLCAAGRVGPHATQRRRPAEP